MQAELLYQRGRPPRSKYLFKHALIQDTAYQSLLRRTRQEVHQRIAQTLETQFPEAAETQPELLAYHYTEAGLTKQAVDYWQQAGQFSLRRSAHREAVSHLTHGLEVLKKLPDSSERVQQELALHLALGTSLIATKGFSAHEVEQTYAYARHLCQHLEEPEQLFQVLRGLGSYYINRAEYQTARALGEQQLSLASQIQDPVLLVMAHRTLGGTLFFLGEVGAASMHFEQGITLYNSPSYRDSGFFHETNDGGYCYGRSAWALWCLGFLDQGLAQKEKTLTLSQQSENPFNISFSLCVVAIIHQCRREWRVVQEYAESTICLATERGFPHWIANGLLLRGLALVQQGRAKEGIDQMHQGLTEYRAIGAEANLSYFLALFAEAYEVMGQPESGLTMLTEALTFVEKTSERWYEPELHRLKGSLLLAQSVDHYDAAEASFQQALSVARHQQARSWELRAATSLARLWQQQGKRSEAHEVLAPVYDWFTEGFDTSDLQEAQALLAELAH